VAEVDTAQLEEVGQRIAAARLAAGLTQRELAESVGTSLGRVDRYELGRSDPAEHLERIAKVPRRSTRWLLTGSDPDETDEAMLAALGHRVQEARHAAGLTESELAAKLGVDEEKVARYESGQEDASTVLDSIAQATGSSRAWLGGENDEPDELDRLLSALAQRRDETKQRQAELDRLEQELRLRESDLEEREQLIRHQQEEVEQEAEQRLRELEELHRNVLASADAFANRASEIRRTHSSGASESEDAAPEEQEQEPAPSALLDQVAAARDSGSPSADGRESRPLPERGERFNPGDYVRLTEPTLGTLEGAPREFMEVSTSEVGQVVGHDAAADLVEVIFEHNSGENGHHVIRLVVEPARLEGAEQPGPADASVAS